MAETKAEREFREFVITKLTKGEASHESALTHLSKINGRLNAHDEQLAKLAAADAKHEQCVASITALRTDV
jgi:hypothetical protein